MVDFQLSTTGRKYDNRHDRWLSDTFTQFRYLFTGDGKSLTFDEVVAQCFVFFIAGFETSSTTMSFALYELSKHPAIQDKVREEIIQVLKKHNNQVTYDAVKEMKYMGQVIEGMYLAYLSSILFSANLQSTLEQ